MNTTLYRGTCTTCGTTKTRFFAEPWIGPLGEDFFGADCPSCGPGHQVLMDPVDQETADVPLVAVQEKTVVTIENEAANVPAMVTKQGLVFPVYFAGLTPNGRSA